MQLMREMPKGRMGLDYMFDGREDCEDKLSNARQSEIPEDISAKAMCLVTFGYPRIIS